MSAQETRNFDAPSHLMRFLPPGRVWSTVAVVVSGKLDGNARNLAMELARRDGTRIVLYDAEASSKWTSPYPPENVTPFLLDEPGVRRSGRDEVADAVRDLQSEGASAGAYLSGARNLDDLRQLVVTEGIDLVICPMPLTGNRVRNVHLARVAGAHLLLCSPGQSPQLLGSLAGDATVPSEQRVSIPFLVGILVAFIAAGLRNRSGS